MTPSRLTRRRYMISCSPYSALMNIGYTRRPAAKRNGGANYYRSAQDVGPAMTDRILKANGEFVPRSTSRDLTIEERENPAHIELRRKFTEICETVLGPKATPGHFTPDELTPEWELFENDDGQEGTVDAPPKELEPTPKANNNYVNVDIMLPRGSKMLRGQVTGRKRDIDGNTDRQA